MDLERYSRHIALEGFGIEGQKKLEAGKVLVIGAGGLGSPVILYLAAAGVGTLGIAEGDRVDLSNLQRQVIHSTDQIGVLKAESAAAKAIAINPELQVKIYPFFLNEMNIGEIVIEYDFVIDATDNFAIKFLINDTCVALGKPFSHGAIQGYQGQLMTVLPGTATYRDLFDSMPEPESVKAGPLGVLPGVIGSLQAAEAIKYLAGIGDLLTDKLLTFDILTMQFHRFRISRNG